MTKKKGLGSVPIALPQQSKKSKWVFLGIGVAATGALSYFGWQYWKKQKEQNTYIPVPPPATNTSAATQSLPADTTYASTPKPRNDNFPLKKGSFGTRVKNLQEALMDQGGASILSTYGADGDFGSVTEAALKKLGYPVEVTESTYNIIINASSADPAALAKEIYTAITKKNYPNALAAVKKMKSTSDYKNAATHFSTYEIDGVHKTIVTALLQAFTSPAQKAALGIALKAAGLEHDDSTDKWSVAGLGEIPPLLITLRPTRVWRNPETSVPVPANMVLGCIVATRGEFSVFENDADYYLVQKNHVGIYQPN